MLKSYLILSGNHHCHLHPDGPMAKIGVGKCYYETTAGMASLLSICPHHPAPHLLAATNSHLLTATTSHLSTVQPLSFFRV